MVRLTPAALPALVPPVPGPAVLEPPPPDHPFVALSQRPDFILTPHVAWASDEAIQGLANQLVENIEMFVKDAPRHLVLA